MKSLANGRACLLIGLWAVSCVPAFATVKIVSFRAWPGSAQPIGTAISWRAQATDSNPNKLTFQFKVAPPGGSSFAVVRDFNVGTLRKSVWHSQVFTWVPTGGEGVYQI